MSLYIEGMGFGIIAAASILLGAMGFTLQFGLTNVLNIGYGALMTFGAFSCYLLHAWGVSVWMAVVLAGIGTSLLTLLVAKTILTVYVRKGAALFEMAMITFGVALILENGLAALTRSNTFILRMGLEHAHTLGPIRFTTTQLILVILAVGVFILLDTFLHLTKVGKALRATAVDPDLARSCGIATNRIITVAWLMSGFLCGMAGGVFTIDIFTVNAFTGDALMPLVIVAALMGKAGSVRGAVLASLVLGIVTQVVSIAGASSYDSVVAYGALAVALLANPKLLQGGLVAERVQITV
jgi:branched-subunit amino acid ABC-type transport system permease component